MWRPYPPALPPPLGQVLGVVACFVSMVANGKSVVDTGAHIVVEGCCRGCTQIHMPFQMDQDRKQQAREMEVVLCRGTKVEQAGGGGVGNSPRTC